MAPLTDALALGSLGIVPTDRPQPQWDAEDEAQTQTGGPCGGFCHTRGAVLGGTRGCALVGEEPCWELLVSRCTVVCSAVGGALSCCGLYLPRLILH